MDIRHRELLKRLHSVRTSARTAYFLRMMVLVIGPLLSLVWTRVLVDSMGRALYGLFISFSAFISIGSLGELGIPGAISLKAWQYKAQQHTKDLRDFLANARGLCLTLAAIVFIVLIIMSGKFPQLLGFMEIPGSGPLSMLFAVGAVVVSMGVVYSYVHGLNYAVETLSWPIVTTFVLYQAGVISHCILAYLGLPLWAQYIPYAAASVLLVLAGWVMLRAVNIDVGKVLPLSFNMRRWASIIVLGLWYHLAFIANTLNISIDRILINMGFGSSAVPPYTFNYRLCELASVLVLYLTFVSLPGMVPWLSSNRAEDREKLLAKIDYINRLQLFVGCVAVLGYMAVNNEFIRIWLGYRFCVPLSLQAVFACTLAVSSGSWLAFGIMSRCGEAGARHAGILAISTAIINLALSYIAMKMGYVIGIASATVVAASILSVLSGRYLCRYLGLPFGKWIVTNYAIPIAVTIMAYGIRVATRGHDIISAVSVVILYGAIALALRKLFRIRVREAILGKWRKI